MQRVIEEIRRRSTGIPGARAVFVTQMPLFRPQRSTAGRDKPGDRCQGPWPGRGADITAAIEDQARTLPGINFVLSFEWGNPELQVAVDREKTSDLGLSVSEVGYTVETLIAGTLAGLFGAGERAGLDPPRHDARQARTQTLDNIVLYPPRGGPIRLVDIADIREAEGPTKIEHIDRDRSIKLTVNLQDKVSMQEAIDTLNTQVIHTLRHYLPLGYSITVSGQAKDLDHTWDSLKWSFLLALIIIYLLMCSLYESFTYPFIIMFSVPPALVGGVLGVRIMHTIEPTMKMDVIAMLGFIIMAGHCSECRHPLSRTSAHPYARGHASARCDDGKRPQSTAADFHDRQQHPRLYPVGRLQWRRV